MAGEVWGTSDFSTQGKHAPREVYIWREKRKFVCNGRVSEALK